jgi:hypothetical protein
MKDYLKISGVCEYCYLNQFRLSPVGHDNNLNATLTFELKDSNKQLIDMVSLDINKAFDHNPSVAEKIEFIQINVAEAIATSKEIYAGYSQG